ncbi:isoprenylcysteine carboxyl methyltransferase family protein [Caldalkalibacillus salinus]|uniref:isoprenylcysteine carboxyl methyltransferase family protein n=1 Tax=Caldalkalibacillus salinus TaxID=2803787 RepID=UPI001920E714|nr:isoprenylcysteine carboxylmethyltransferase family protein [Caldalkalibacillus salinus]
MFFSILIAIVVLQRCVELQVAKGNEKWIRSQGGYEVGEAHYKLIVAMHLLFFVSLITEVQYHQRELASWWVLPFILFIVAQGLRVWSLTSLGRFWNTKIMVLPDHSLVKKGPYRYLKHPNYVVVATEILALPFIFQAYFTLIVFTILNAFVLRFIRIPAEERALGIIRTEETDKS